MCLCLCVYIEESEHRHAKQGEQHVQRLRGPSGMVDSGEQCLVWLGSTRCLDKGVRDN